MSPSHDPAAAHHAEQPRTPYSQEAVGLLEQIAVRALDDDYYRVQEDRPSRSRTANSLATLLVVVLFALMITVTAVQNYRERPASQLTRDTLVSDVREQRSLLQEREREAATLSAEVEALQAVDGTTAAGQRVRILSGAIAVQGDGFDVTLDPGNEAGDDGEAEISDAELRSVVNALWAAGAEAVAINRQRIGALTSIRSAGGAITVNFRSIAPPYRIEAIGPPATLRDRYLASGEDAYWERRANGGTLRYEAAVADGLALPAAPVNRTSITYAVPEGGTS